MKLQMTTLLLIATVWTSSAFAGKHQKDLYHAASALDRAAYELHDRVSEYRHGEVVRIAYDIAKAADKFHRRVERGRASDVLWRDYEVIADCFADLKYKLSHGRYARNHRDHYGLKRFERVLGDTKYSLLSIEAYSQNHYNNRSYGNRTYGWYTKGANGRDYRRPARQLPVRPFSRY